MAQDNRLAGKLFETTTDPKAGRELRVYALGPELIRRHSDILLRVDQIQWKARLKAALLSGASWAVFAIGLAVSIYVALAGSANSLSDSNVLLIFILATQIAGQTQAASFIVSAISRELEIYGRYQWVRTRLAEHAERSGCSSPPSTLASAIRLANVSFTYPGASQPSLRGISLDLKAGTTVALVGANGAGKSTLVKLLLRLYEPTSGEIYLDGTRLSSIDYRSWQGRLAAGFQDFARFELVAVDSITVGDLPRLSDKAAAKTALARAGAPDLASDLPMALDTKLGKTFGDGIDLSEGQWQKVALGRAMMREAPVIQVFDEPTASLDAGTEARLFDGYQRRRMSVGKAVGCVTILVSHRFATVRSADQIVVLDGGQILESGTHAELMELSGQYARRYKLQASDYK